jgi:hypothetical protein
MCKLTASSPLPRLYQLWRVPRRSAKRRYCRHPRLPGLRDGPLFVRDRTRGPRATGEELAGCLGWPACCQRIATQTQTSKLGGLTNKARAERPVAVRRARRFSSIRSRRSQPHPAFSLCPSTQCPATSVALTCPGGVCADPAQADVEQRRWHAELARGNDARPSCLGVDSER